MMLNSTHKKTGVGRPGQSQNNQRFQSLGDIVAQFIDAMCSSGVAPADPGVIIADGVLHRFRVEGDKQGSMNGYYTLHLDGAAAGSFGSWKHGVSESWCAINRGSLTPAQRDENRRRMDASRKAAADLRDQKNKSAAARAVYLWNQALPAPDTHPYLVRKGIKTGIARQKDDALVLPIHSFTGELKSLQFIQPDGSKRFLTGGQKKACFIVVNDPDNARRIVICEGFATGATLAEHDPTSTVIAALDAGNLESVALALRTKHPDADIVIALDFDAVGRAKGIEAAQASRAQILPVPENVPEWVTDWNDYAALVKGGRHEH